MDYPGPQHTDFTNVRSLNREYLKLLTCAQWPAQPAAGLPDTLAARLLGLRPAQCERLAGAPFLLFSFRERDGDFWDRLLSDDLHPDLFDSGSNGVAMASRLIAAGLGFVWQLACQNPYAARLICGASMHWCERLAENTLLEVVTVAANHGGALVMREAANEALWHKLLYDGVSRQRELCRAAHISALQCVLTASGPVQPASSAIAARSFLSPALRVADEIDR